MKTHQMIELPSAIGNLEDDSPIYIYSTINIFCSAADINELVEMFKGETGETEEQKEAEYSEKTQDQCCLLYTSGSALKALEDPNGEWGDKIMELMDTVDSYIPDPERDTDKPFLMPVEDVFTITGRGTVATGRDVYKRQSLWCCIYSAGDPDC